MQVFFFFFSHQSLAIDDSLNFPEHFFFFTLALGPDHAETHCFLSDLLHFFLLMVFLPQLPQLQATIPKFSGQFLHTGLRLGKSNFLMVESVTQTSRGLGSLLVLLGISWQSIQTFDVRE